MERHIAIIGAMDEEVEALSQSLTSAALDSSRFKICLCSPVIWLTKRPSWSGAELARCMPPLLPNT